MPNRMPNSFLPAARHTTGRPAMVLRDKTQARRAAEWAMQAERRAARGSMLLSAGIAAGLYVAVRIGLTYAVLAH